MSARDLNTPWSDLPPCVFVERDYDELRQELLWPADERLDNGEGRWMLRPRPKSRGLQMMSTACCGL